MPVIAKRLPLQSIGVSEQFRASSIVLLCCFLSVVTPSISASAQTLEDSLAEVHETSPELMAARESVKEAQESVAIARGEGLPHAEANGTAGIINTDIGGVDTDNTSEAYSLGVRVSQALYTGGRINAAINAANSVTDATIAQMQAKEQVIFLEAITAYMNVIRDQPILELKSRKLPILKKRLSRILDGQKVGRATLTDIRQAEALIAGAEAEKIQAQGNLAASRSEFERVIGMVPKALIAPTKVNGLPNSEDEAMGWAENRSPIIIAAQHAARAADSNVKRERGAKLPEIGLEGFALYGRSTVFNSGVANLLTTDDDFRGIGAVVRVRIPLFQGGKISAKTRQAEAQATQRNLQIISARRSVRDGVIRAWQALQATQSVIRARDAQITAAQLALEGIVLENNVGRRTDLEVLDAEQQLFDAQTMKIKAERDWLVASYAVLAAVGRLTAKDLGIQGDDILRRSAAAAP